MTILFEYKHQVQHTRVSFCIAIFLEIPTVLYTCIHIVKTRVTWQTVSTLLNTTSNEQRIHVIEWLLTLQITQQMLVINNITGTPSKPQPWTAKSSRTSLTSACLARHGSAVGMERSETASTFATRHLFASFPVWVFPLPVGVNNRHHVKYWQQTAESGATVWQLSTRCTSKFAYKQVRKHKTLKYVDAQNEFLMPIKEKSQHGKNH